MYIIIIICIYCCILTWWSYCALTGWFTQYPDAPSENCIDIWIEMNSKLIIVGYFIFVLEGKQLACSRECKFIETSSGIQHNVDELLVGVLKQIRLRETRDKKKLNQRKTAIHGSKTSLSLHIAKEILQKMCLLDSKSKSCGNLHVL